MIKGLCLKEKGQYIDNSTLHWGRMLSTSAAASMGFQNMNWERSKAGSLALLAHHLFLGLGLQRHHAHL